jgi:hypothetical protein
MTVYHALLRSSKTVATHRWGKQHFCGVGMTFSRLHPLSHGEGITSLHCLSASFILCAKLAGFFTKSFDESFDFGWWERGFVEPSRHHAGAAESEDLAAAIPGVVSS